MPLIHTRPPTMGRRNRDSRGTERKRNGVEQRKARQLAVEPAAELLVGHVLEYKAEYTGDSIIHFFITSEIAYYILPALRDFYNTDIKF